MAAATATTVFTELVQARSSSLLRTAFLLTGDQAAAERLLHDGLVSARSNETRPDPFEAEGLVRAEMVRLAVGPFRIAPERVVAALSRHEGLTDPEIAHLLGCSSRALRRARARADGLELGVADDVGSSDELRAHLTDDLGGPPPPQQTDWPLLVTVALAAMIVAVLSIAIWPDPGPAEDRDLPHSGFGNARVLTWMRPGDSPRVPVRHHEPASMDRFEGVEPEPYAAARDTARVLFRAAGPCDVVAVVERSGRLRPLRSWCGARLLSLSPRGTTILVGSNHAESPEVAGSVVHGLLDVATGDFTILPELARLQQYGDDLVSATWEDSDTVLLAYLVTRDEARVVRCHSATSGCELTPVEYRPPPYDTTP